MSVRSWLVLLGICVCLALVIPPSESTAATGGKRIYVPSVANTKKTATPTKTPSPTKTPTRTPSPTQAPLPSVTPVAGTIVVQPGADLRAAAEATLPGQTLLLRGGTYDMGSTRALIWLTGVNGGRVRMSSYPGERAVIRGLVRLEMVYATVDNITFEWGQGSSSDHMVKIVDGSDWVFESNEVRGAQSFACIQIGDAPVRWVIRNNYIHDCVGGNGNENQNHGIYADIPGSDAGLIEGNTIVNTPLGKSIKLGPSTETSPGARNVTVRGNTMRDASHSVISLSGSSIANVVIENNTMSGADESAVRFYSATGDAGSIVVRNNQWSATPAYCDDTDSTLLCAQVVR